MKGLPYTLEMVEVTHAIAVEYLAKGNNIRNINQATADSYARDMENGNWTSGILDPIVFCDADDGTEEMMNGQHRMEATKKYTTKFPDASITFFIARHVPKELIIHMDRGLPRTTTAIFNSYVNDRLVKNEQSTLNALLSSGHTRAKASVDELIKAHDKMKHYLSKLCDSNAPVYRQAHSLKAVVLQLWENPTNEEYIVEQFNIMCNYASNPSMTPSITSPIVQKFMDDMYTSKIATQTTMVTPSNRTWLGAQLHYVLDKNNANLTEYVVDDAYKQNIDRLATIFLSEIGL